MNFRFLLSLVLISLSSSLCLAENFNVGDPSAPNAIESTSSKKVNIRSHAGIGYDIVDQLNPGQIAWAVGNKFASDGWIEINTGKTHGYVSKDYIRGINGDYLSYLSNPEAFDNKTSRKSSSGSLFDDFQIRLYDIFEYYNSFPYWVMLIMTAILIACQVFVILWLKNRYYFHRNPFILYLIIIPSLFLTACVLLMEPEARREASGSCYAWYLLLACVMPLAVHSCWRLEQNGKIRNRQKIDGCYDATIGKALGILLWMGAVLPMLGAMIYVEEDTFDLIYNFHIPDTTMAMLITMVVITGINYGISMGWLWLASATMHTLSNFSLYLVSAAVAIVVVKADITILDDFNGFTFLFALLLMVPSLGFFAGTFANIRAFRCANCHHFAGEETGVTDGGYSTHTSDSWHDIADSSIHSSNVVKNARELRRTYTTMHNWTNHYECEYCSQRWSIDHSEEVHSETHALKRKWDEYY